jgi:hypothetical protein
MTYLQSYALTAPLTRASESLEGIQNRRIIDWPWSIMLTVNK